MHRDVNKGIVLPCAYVLTLTVINDIDVIVFRVIYSATDLEKRLLYEGC